MPVAPDGAKVWIVLGVPFPQDPCPKIFGVYAYGGQANLARDKLIMEKAGWRFWVEGQRVVGTQES